jgi:hypothetical protein
MDPERSDLIDGLEAAVQAAKDAVASSMDAVSSSRTAVRRARQAIRESADTTAAVEAELEAGPAAEG